MSRSLTFGIDVEIIDDFLPIFKANFSIVKYQIIANLKKKFQDFFTFYFWVRKIAREESISPHASRHKPPKVVSVRVLNLQIVIWCNKLCIPQHHVLDTTQIICLVFLFSTKVYTRVHQSRALYPMCAMRKSNSKPSKHHHIENSFESHNELRHGISGKFVINDTSRLRLGVRPRDSGVTFLTESESNNNVTFDFW